MDELWERLQDVWTGTSLDYLQELYNSLPRHMARKHSYSAKIQDLRNVIQQYLNFPGAESK
ncbi:hypothetical protein BGZ82_003208, partial [Podila clonocystis]